MNNLPTVTIGCPVRNREKFLTEYLKCIDKMIYPKEKISLLFVLNDSTDGSKQILYDFKNNNQELYHRIKIETYNLNAPPDSREHEVRQRFIYNSLSKLRNFWMANIKTDYALSCDSDIMMPPDTLMKLVRHKKDYVAGLICNGYLFNPPNPYKFTNILRKRAIPSAGNGGYVHINEYPEDTLIEVDFSGAVFLVSKKAYKVGKFAYHYQGEDGAFCQSLQDNGLRLFCDTSAKCTHCMDERYLNAYKNGKFIW